MTRRIRCHSTSPKSAPSIVFACLLVSAQNQPQPVIASGPPLSASQANSPPSISFTLVPPTGAGSPKAIENIEGVVQGAMPGQRIVLYTQAAVWWVQPLADQPFNDIQPDSVWKGTTHPVTAYAALLVDPQYFGKAG